MQMKPVARIKKRQSEKQDPFLVFINEARAWLKVEWPKVAAGVVALMLAGSFFVDRFTGVDKTDWRGTADIVSAYQQAAFGDPKGAIKEMDRIRTEYDGIAERLAILGKGDLMMEFGDSVDQSGTRPASYYFEIWIDDFDGPPMDLFHAYLGFAAALRQQNQPRRSGILLEKYAESGRAESGWAPIALEQAALSFIDADEFDRAKKVLDRLLREFPKSAESQRSGVLMNELNGALMAASG